MPHLHQSQAWGMHEDHTRKHSSNLTVSGSGQVQTWNIICLLGSSQVWPPQFRAHVRFGQKYVGWTMLHHFCPNLNIKLWVHAGKSPLGSVIFFDRLPQSLVQTFMYYSGWTVITFTYKCGDKYLHRKQDQWTGRFFFTKVSNQKKRNSKKSTVTTDCIHYQLFAICKVV